MKMIASYEAKSHFSKLLQAAADGEVFVITRNGTKMAELRPCSPTPHGRIRGALRDQFGPIKAGFNDVPAEFSEYQ